MWYKDSSYGIEYYQFNIDNNDGVYIPQEGGGYNLRHDFNSNPNLGGLPLRNFSILNFNDNKLIGIENITDALKNGNGLFFQLLAYDDSMNANVFIGGTFDTFQVNSVPVPAAIWLFGTSLMALVGIKKKKLINKYI